MKNKKKFSLKRFLNYDIRVKIKSIEKKIKLKLYPSYFKFSGFRKYYTYFIFNLIFFEKVFKKKKEIYNQIKKITDISENRINSLYCLPSSGSNFLRNFFQSYLEIRYGIGNGIPKFNNYTDNKWHYSDTIIFPADLFSNIKLENESKNNEWKFYDKRTFLKERVIAGRYPLKDMDLFKIENTKPLVLFREPHDWLISVYVRRIKIKHYKGNNLDDINHELIDHSIARYKKFLKFWIDFLKSKNMKEFLVVNFDDLTKKNSKSTILNILNFFQIPIDESAINKSLQYNSKEFVLTDLKTDFKGTRFIDENEKIKLKKKIDEIINKKFNDQGILKLYDELKKLSKKLN